MMFRFHNGITHEPPYRMWVDGHGNCRYKWMHADGGESEYIITECDAEAEEYLKALRAEYALARRTGSQVIELNANGDFVELHWDPVAKAWRNVRVDP